MAIREYTGLGGRLAPIKAARGAGDDYGATAEPDWRTVDWQAHLHQVPIRGRRVTLKLPSGRKTAVRVVLRVRRQGRSRAQVVRRTFARC